MFRLRRAILISFFILKFLIWMLKATVFLFENPPFKYIEIDDAVALQPQPGNGIVDELFKFVEEFRSLAINSR